MRSVKIKKTMLQKKMPSVPSPQLIQTISIPPSISRSVYEYRRTEYMAMLHIILAEGKSQIMMLYRESAVF